MGARVRPYGTASAGGWTAIDGTSSAADGALYDDELKKRVATFQQSESLTPDGIAGEETLVRLTAATPGGSTPSLTGARP